MLFPPMRKNCFWFAAGVAWFALVLFLSLTSSRSIIRMVGSIHFGEQAAHALSYGLLVYCFLKAFDGYFPAWTVGGFCFGLGVAVEILQWLGGNRGFEVIDIVSNFAGIVIGYLVLLVQRNRQLLFR